MQPGATATSSVLGSRTNKKAAYAFPYWMENFSPLGSQTLGKDKKVTMAHRRRLRMHRYVFRTGNEPHGRVLMKDG